MIFFCVLSFSSISLRISSSSTRKSTWIVLERDFPSWNTCCNSCTKDEVSADSFILFNDSSFSLDTTFERVDSDATVSVLSIDIEFSTTTGSSLAVVSESFLFSATSFFSSTVDWFTTVFTPCASSTGLDSVSFLTSPSCFSSTDVAVGLSDISVACTIFEMPFK